MNILLILTLSHDRSSGERGGLEIFVTNIYKVFQLTFCLLPLAFFMSNYFVLMKIRFQMLKKGFSTKQCNLF